MIGILCIEEEGGILFHQRRVSRDRLLIDWIMQKIEGKSLWMREYSKGLFADYSVKIAEDYLTQAGEEDYCFIEDGTYLEYLDKMSGLLLCRWKRHYPSDLKFQESILAEGWQMEAVYEVNGSSHETITVEEWKKGDGSLHCGEGREQ